MAPQHLVLANPFDSSSSEDDPTVTIPSTPTNGLRAQLHQLLPRHVIFHASVHIHQISNIPLVSGEFAVKWKFKNVHTPSTSKQGGLLGIVKGKPGKDKGKDENDDEDAEVNSQGSSDPQLSSSSQLLSVGWKPPSTPSSATFSTASSRTAVSSTTSAYGSSSRSSSSSAPLLIHTTSAPPSSFTLHSNASTVTTVAPSTTSSGAQSSLTPARGQTTFLPLREHSVIWDHALDLLIRMDVERDTSNLLSSPMTLVVLQAGTPHVSSKGKTASAGHKQANTRLGIIYLDLAQYADKGEVGRRYLLRDSKTNATLKLTISVTRVSGDTSYNAPPLPKGEISNGISGILEENEIYRTRPRGLNLYGPYEDQEELEIDLLGVKAKGKDKQDRHSKSQHRHTRTASAPIPIFDPERLPHAYGPKTTETLIEALFNPVIVREQHRESPFTVYVQPGKPEPSLNQPNLGGIGAPGAEVGGGGSGGVGGAVGMSRDGVGAGNTGPRPIPTRSGSSGIGAGLGIMGLGMGMGIGMGVSLGVAGRASSETKRTSHDGPGGRTSRDGYSRSSIDHHRPSLDGRRLTFDVGERRQPSQGAASIWSSSTDMSGVSADVSASNVSTRSGISGWSGSENGRLDEKKEGSVSGKMTGVRGWFKKISSRPSTPTPSPGLLSVG